jgi:two-component system CheB/CheR fusion protein
MINKEKKSKVLKNQFIPTTEFYSNIVDSLQDYSILTVDHQLKINSWNPGAEKIFQYQPHEILGKPFATIFTERDKKEGIPKKEIDVALKEGRSVDIRWHLCKDGTTFYADGLVFPLKDDDGKLTGYVKILRDITERKKN